MYIYIYVCVYVYITHYNTISTHLCLVGCYWYYWYLILLHLKASGFHCNDTHWDTAQLATSNHDTLAPTWQVPEWLRLKSQSTATRLICGLLFGASKCLALAASCNFTSTGFGWSDNCAFGVVNAEWCDDSRLQPIRSEWLFESTFIKETGQLATLRRCGTCHAAAQRHPKHLIEFLWLIGSCWIFKSLCTNPAAVCKPCLPACAEDHKVSWKAWMWLLETLGPWAQGWVVFRP